MLTSRQLISYDPDDSKPVSSFHLAPLPETEGTMSCLEVGYRADASLHEQLMRRQALNFFQQGRSHMLLVRFRSNHNFQLSFRVT